MKLYETIESHTYPHTHDHRTEQPCKHCGAVRRWVVEVDEPLYRIDYDHLDMHDVVKAAKIKSVLVRVNGAGNE